MQDLHQIQMLILRELLFNPHSRFSELNIKGLTSDHFSYHINTLVDLGLVNKKEQTYSLTSDGKEYANCMDTDQVQIEKQPKVGVMIVPFKSVKGKKYLLIQERTKEPYFGYKGFITGKVRYGEKFKETAKRELKEESGLDCDNFTIKEISHEHVVMAEDGRLMEDKIFIIITAKNPKGEIADTENGKIFWVTEEEFFNMEKKYYNEDGAYESSKKRKTLDICEDTYAIQEF